MSESVPEKFRETLADVADQIEEAWLQQHTDLTEVELGAATILALMAPELVRHSPGLAEGILASWQVDPGTEGKTDAAAPAATPEAPRGFYL